MNYRVATLFEEKAYTADEVEPISIDIVDPISEILLNLKTLSDGVNTAPTAHFAAGISKIELIDGSDVLFSLDGYQAQALDYYDRGNFRSPWNAYLDNNYGDISIGLNFGRYLWDRELAFDPSKFTNPKLNVSLDVGAGGIASDGLKLEVLGSVFDERTVAPRGFLMSKEIKEYTRVASSHEYTDMPTDYPYRKMFVQCLRAGKEPGQLLNTLKLSENGGKKIPFNVITFENILRSIASQRPPIREAILQNINTSQTYGYCIPTTRVFGEVTDWHTTTEITNTAFYNGDGGRYELICDVQGEAQVFVEGYLPHGVYEIPFGLPNEISDWYNTPGLKGLKADILQKSEAVSSETVNIFLQQYRSY